ncbi:MAG: hypothetical protein G01um10142_470 [Parcubacteria group bacterium Gr01-1014_2]|nr:MAG: hypothetical protein G01um10142_470 [Parcubacteria group bacterium Gr01-1014_2]
MLVETDFLIVRHEPSIGGLIRATLTKYRDLIAGKRQWQDGKNVCLAITLARPDTDDEGEKTRFNYSLSDFADKLQASGASVEKRNEAA